MYIFFRMWLNLNNYQFKASRYSYGSTYLNSMVTTSQKYTIDSQKPKRKELKQTTKENYKTTTRKTKEDMNKERKKTPEKQGLKWH